ncbi:HNH endonuclease signature motif containing protein [Heyndrickxia oleronia]|uniref:HNH endonuclease n=1 Tax=Heyndrickxia oleronia TaxID=38875 RepID=UPI003F20C475
MKIRLDPEEKERRKLERQQRKYDETHRTIDNVLNKLCSICNKWHPMNNDYFYSNKSNGIDGYNPYCIDCTKKRNMIWTNDNPEKIKEAKRKYNKSPKGRPKLAANAKRRKENGEYTKWVQNNPDYFSNFTRNRNQSKKHEISDNEWSACKKYFKDSCAYCNLHIDEHYIIYAGELKKTDLHKEHVDDKGSNKLDNCVPSCQACNSSKWAKEFDDFYNENNPTFTFERLEKIQKWLKEDHKLYMETK